MGGRWTGEDIFTPALTLGGDGKGAIAVTMA